MEPFNPVLGAWGCRELVSWVVPLQVRGGPVHPIKGTSASPLAGSEARVQGAGFAESDPRLDSLGAFLPSQRSYQHANSRKLCQHF